MSEREPDTEAVKGFYDERWAETTFPGGAKLERYTRILEAVSMTKLRAPRILELGCGTGGLANLLVSVGQVAAVDLSEVAIRQAKDLYPQVSFSAADILHWKPPHGDFDLVISHEVVEHVPNQPRYLEVASSALRAGGFLILTTPNLPACRHLPAEVSEAYRPQPIEHWLSSKELRALLSRHFDVVRLTSLGHGPGGTGIYRLNSPLFRAMWKRLGVGWMVDGLVLRAGLGLSLLAVARKP